VRVPNDSDRVPVPRLIQAGTQFQL
jgi:hypothetical protein